MSRDKKEKKVRIMPVGIGILIFLLAFGAGVVSKVAIKPSWAKDYSVKWSDEIGTLKSDLSYGDGAAKYEYQSPTSREDASGSGGAITGIHPLLSALAMYPIARSYHPASPTDGGNSRIT